MQLSQVLLNFPLAFFLTFRSLLCQARGDRVHFACFLFTMNLNLTTLTYFTLLNNICISTRKPTTQKVNYADGSTVPTKIIILCILKMCIPRFQRLGAEAAAGANADMLWISQRRTEKWKNALIWDLLVNFRHFDTLKFCRQFEPSALWHATKKE